MPVYRGFVAAPQTASVGECVRICADMQPFGHSCARLPEIARAGFICLKGATTGLERGIGLALLSAALQSPPAQRKTILLLMTGGSDGIEESSARAVALSDACRRHL